MGSKFKGPSDTPAWKFHAGVLKVEPSVPAKTQVPEVESLSTCQNAGTGGSTSGTSETLHFQGHSPLQGITLTSNYWGGGQQPPRFSHPLPPCITFQWIRLVPHWCWMAQGYPLILANFGSGLSLNLSLRLKCFRVHIPYFFENLQGCPLEVDPLNLELSVHKNQWGTRFYSGERAKIWPN